MGSIPNMGEANLKRFGRYVYARRRELNMGQDAVAEAGGPSDKKQTDIEHGRGPMPRFETLSKYDKALGWEPGSAAAVLHGGEPRLVKPRSVDAAKLDELAQALARHGVSRIAARRHNVTSGGLEFDPDAINQLIDLLNSVPEPGAAAESSSTPPETTQKRRRRGGSAG